MGRHKTVSDEDVLRIAREIFRHHGHTASTRQIALALGISEAVLYQRFGSKDELFFAAMHAVGPDVERLLGPAEPSGNARSYLQGVVTRLGQYFSEIIPLALHVMTHPSARPSSVARVQPGGPAVLVEGLALRLGALARRGTIAPKAETALARLLVSLAHDWALGLALRHGHASRGTRDLREMVEVVWRGVRPDQPHG